MTPAFRRLAPWGWIGAALVFTLLLMLLDASYVRTIESSRRDAGFPVQLGPLEMRLEAETEPTMSPRQAWDSSDWRPSAQPLALGWRRDVVWTRTTLVNTSRLPQEVRMEISPARITHARLYSRDMQGAWSHQDTGAALRSADRPVDRAELLFPLTLAPGERRPVMLAVWSEVTTLNFGMAVFPERAYSAIASRTMVVDAALAGGLLILALMSLALGTAMRQLPLLVLTARILVVAFWQLQQQGITALLLTAPAVHALAHRADLLASATLFLTMAFFWTFLRNGDPPRWARRTLAILVVASLVPALLQEAGLITRQTFPYLIALLSLGGLAFTAVVSVMVLFRNFTPAFAVLVGVLIGLAVNTPLYSLMLGWTGGGVVRYFVSPLPALATSILMFVGAALHLARERAQLNAALQAEQRSAVLTLENQVAQRTVELVAARDSALKADREKTFFLAKVSHELRTPLHALLGYLELSRRETSLAGVRQQLGAVDVAGRDLARHVDDLLDFARLGREQLVLQASTTSLYGVARRVIERAQLLADDRGNELRLLPCVGLPDWVEVDAHRLEQILMILLSNALRYTTNGTVTLSLAAEPWDGVSGSCAVRFEVHDTGRGIAPEALATVFLPFERGQSSDGEGLGLGLPIAQHLLRAMGSEMHVTSQPGMGSRFSFVVSLPRGDESQVQEDHPDHDFTGYHGPTRHVLALDDNPANLAFLRELLGDVGFAVIACADVTSATAVLLRHAGEGSPVDLCIVDQRLAGAESGWDVLAVLRRQSEASGWARIPVLMLSANEPFAPEGFDPHDAPERHLCKPARPAALLRAVGELLQLNWFATRPRRRTARGQNGIGSRAVDPVDAWQAVLAAAEAGDLSALDAWSERHAGWLAAEPGLARAIKALDFASIAEHAKAHLASASATS